MNEGFARQAVKYRNEFRQSVGQLVGLITGLLADQHLDDTEIRFLHDWITAHDEITYEWPGNIIAARVKSALADGIINEAERAHLVETLQQLVGGTNETLAHASQVTELVFDDPGPIVFTGIVFCLTGNFVYAPRESCEAKVVERGGIIKSGVSRRVRYVVVGSLGSPEWKHGSFGTKIAKAMALKLQGVSIAIVKEDAWAAAL